MNQKPMSNKALIDLTSNITLAQALAILSDDTEPYRFTVADAKETSQRKQKCLFVWVEESSKDILAAVIRDQRGTELQVASAVEAYPGNIIFFLYHTSILLHRETFNGLDAAIKKQFPSVKIYSAIKIRSWVE